MVVAFQGQRTRDDSLGVEDPFCESVYPLHRFPVDSLTGALLERGATQRGVGAARSVDIGIYEVSSVEQR